MMVSGTLPGEWRMSSFPGTDRTVGVAGGAAKRTLSLPILVVGAGITPLYHGFL